MILALGHPLIWQEFCIPALKQSPEQKVSWITGSFHGNFSNSLTVSLSLQSVIQAIAGYSLKTAQTLSPQKLPVASLLPWSASVCLPSCILLAPSHTLASLTPQVLCTFTSPQSLGLCLCFPPTLETCKLPCLLNCISRKSTHPSVLTQLSCEILKWCHSALYYVFTPPDSSVLYGTVFCMCLLGKCVGKRYSWLNWPENITEPRDYLSQNIFLRPLPLWIHEYKIPNVNTQGCHSSLRWLLWEKNIEGSTSVGTWGRKESGGRNGRPTTCGAQEGDKKRARLSTGPVHFSF